MFRPRFAALALLGACLCLPLAHGQDGQRPLIIGGSDATPGDYPFVAAIIDAADDSSRDGQFCGGTLVAERWVLTAAHCVEWIDSASEIEVVIGETTLAADRSGRIAVSEFTIHPDYDDVTLANDVALLGLATPSAATVVPLADAPQVSVIPLGADVIALGWGLVDDDPATGTFVLQEVEVDFISQLVCNTADYYGFPILPDQVCAGAFVTEPVPGGEFPQISGGFGICNGDSGGPLLHNGTQIGIASFGPDSACAEVDVPDGYSNVGFHRDWINSIINSVDLAVNGSLDVVSATEYDVTFTVTNRSTVNTASGVALVFSTPVGAPVFINPEADPACTGAVPTCTVAAIAPGGEVSFTFRVEAPEASVWRVRGAVDLPADTNARNDADQVGMGSITPQPPFGGGGGDGGGLPWGALLLLATLALRRRG